MNKIWIALACFWVLPPVRTSAAEVTFENPRTSLVLGEDATWRCWRDKAAGRQLIPEGPGTVAAVVQHGGKSFPANRASQDDHALTLGFAGTDTVLQYHVRTEPDWIVFRLETVQGTRPEHLTLLQLPVGLDANLGRRLNAAWDDQTTACLMAAGMQTDCRPRAGKFAVLQAMTQDSPGPPLEGAAAAVIVSSTEEFKSIARAASHAFGLPTNEDAQGTPVKDTELARGSYWFLSLAESDADRMIQLCDQTGIRQVMLSSGASWPDPVFDPH